MNSTQTCKLKLSKALQTTVLYDGKPFVVTVHGKEVRALLSTTLKKGCFPIFKGRECMVRKLRGQGISGNGSWEIVAVLCSPWEVVRRLTPRTLQYQTVAALKATKGKDTRLWYPHADNRDFLLDCTVHSIKTKYKDADRLIMPRLALKRKVRALPRKHLVYVSPDAKTWALLWGNTEIVNFFVHRVDDKEDLLVTGCLTDEYDKGSPESEVLSHLRKLCANATVVPAKLQV